MGKIYDALKRAENEAKLRRAGGEPRAHAAPAPSARKFEPDTESSSSGLVEQHSEAQFIESSRDNKIVPSLQVLTQVTADDRKTSTQVTLKDVSERKKKRAPANIPIPLVALAAPQSPEAEQFRILKSRVLGFCQEKGLRTLLITSCMPEEGKSTVAANLSVSIANGINDHALLLDCDLRRPSIHKVFKLNSHSRGLTDCLMKDMPLQKAIHATGIEKLAIIPAGSVPDNPSDLISSNKMIELLHEVKTRYDDRYIVLDSTPAYQTPEPDILSRHVDGVILVVRAGKTGRDIIVNVVESLGKNTIIGTVFNMVREPVRSYYYNYDSYYSKKPDD